VSCKVWEEVEWGRLLAEVADGSVRLARAAVVLARLVVETCHAPRNIAIKEDHIPQLF
jgi:hypothetical protein